MYSKITKIKKIKNYFTNFHNHEKFYRRPKSIDNTHLAFLTTTSLHLLIFLHLAFHLAFRVFSSTVLANCCK